MLESDLPFQDTTNSKTEEKENGNPIGGNADVVEKNLVVWIGNHADVRHTHVVLKLGIPAWPSW